MQPSAFDLLKNWKRYEVFCQLKTIFGHFQRFLAFFEKLGHFVEPIDLFKNLVKTKQKVPSAFDLLKLEVS